MLWFLMGALISGVGGFVVFLYFMRKGQFEDCEDVKYQLFREEEDEDAKI